MKTTILLVMLLFVAGLTPALAVDERPNFLFIIADDQSPFDLSVYRANSRLETPTIDSLAAEGVVIDRAYQMGAWSGGVCTASRHMIMSGRSVWHIPDKLRYKGKRNPNAMNPQFVPPDLADHTMAAVFNAAGYDTMRTCKKGNSYAAANGKFTVVKDATKRGATDDSGSAWHAEQVLHYLSRRQELKDDDPFLIYLGFSHPHDTRNGKPELLEKYGAINHANPAKTLPRAHDGQPPLPNNYLPTHPFNNTDMNVRDETRVSGVWQNRDESTIRNEIGRQYACSENIDQQIAKVLAKLKAMGEFENTYIVYTSDHGMAIGRHGLQGKQNLYEHTWRVPFIVKGPGIPAGTRVPGNIYLLDVLATLCDLAEVPAPSTNQGMSFAKVLVGQQDTVRDVLYGAYCGGGKPGIRAVRQGDWKLIKYEIDSPNYRHTQLFNLAENPDELLSEHQDPVVVSMTGATPDAKQINLADNLDYAVKRKEMEQLLLKEMKAHNDPFRFSDLQ